MDVFVYGCDKKEEPYIAWCRNHLHLAIESTPHRVTLDNVMDCKGASCISVLSTPLPAPVLEALYQIGVRFISTRTIGYDHIDLAACRRLGLHVSNVSYAAESVADYTIMLVLMSMRKMKLIMKSAEVQDYSFTQVTGRNLKERSVGVIGTGSIGTTFIQHLHGFGCRIYAYSRHPREELKDIVTYTDLDTLLQHSDVISLHLPLNEDTYHMIDADAISKMKDGVVLVNTARGGLIDNQALIAGLETGKIGAAALDVVEGESGIYYSSQKGKVLAAREMAILNSYPNVILSPHMAFLTEESTRDMVLHSMESCHAFLNEGMDGKEIC